MIPKDKYLIRSKRQSDHHRESKLGRKLQNSNMDEEANGGADNTTAAASVFTACTAVVPEAAAEAPHQGSPSRGPP